MEQKALRKILWEEAGKAGLALGAVSSAYLFLSQFAGTLKMPALLSMLVTTILWAGKFGGCIWLMMYFMKKFVRENPDIVKQNIKNKFQDNKLPLVDEVIALEDFEDTCREVGITDEIVKFVQRNWGI